MRRFYNLYEQNFTNLRPLFSLLFHKDSKNLKSLDNGLREVGAKRRIGRVNKLRRKESVKNFFCRGVFTPFTSKCFFNLTPLLSIVFFPKDSENLKSFDIGLQEVGAKRPLSRVGKCDRQTNTQTNIETF